MKGLAIGGNCTLSPAFRPNIFDYSCSVLGDIESVNITYNSTEPGNAVTLAGHTDMFLSGYHLLEILVIAQPTNGIVYHNKYQVTVNKAKSLNVRLKDMVIPQCPTISTDVKTNFALNGNVKTFHCEVEFETTFVEVFPEAHYPDAVVTFTLGSQETVKVADPAQQLSAPTKGEPHVTTTITVNVISEAGNHTHATYIVEVKRKANQDATLRELSSIDCVIMPAFNPNITDYSCSIPDEIAKNWENNKVKTLALRAVATFDQEDGPAGANAIVVAGWDTAMGPSCSDQNLTCYHSSSRGFQYLLHCTDANSTSNPCSRYPKPVKNFTNTFTVTLYGSTASKVYTVHTFIAQPEPVSTHIQHLSVAVTHLGGGVAITPIHVPLKITGVLNVTDPEQQALIGTFGFDYRATNLTVEFDYAYEAFQVIEAWNWDATLYLRSANLYSVDKKLVRVPSPPIPGSPVTSYLVNSFKIDTPGTALCYFSAFLFDKDSGSILFASKHNILVTRKPIDTAGDLSSIDSLRQRCVLTPAFNPAQRNYKCTVPNTVVAVAFVVRTGNSLASLYRSDGSSAPFEIFHTNGTHYFESFVGDLVEGKTARVTFLGLVKNASAGGVQNFALAANYTIEIEREHQDETGLLSFTVANCSTFRPVFHTDLDSYECSVPFSQLTLETSHVLLHNESRSVTVITPSSILAVGERHLVNVTVTSPSNKTTTSRTITVVRREDDFSQLQSLNAIVPSSFGVSQCILTPAFDPARSGPDKAYICLLEERARSIDVHVSADRTRGLTVEGPSGNDQLMLGHNDVEIVVYAKDLVTHTSYFIDAVRANDNTKLVDISIPGCAFKFDPNVRLFRCTMALTLGQVLTVNFQKVYTFFYFAQIRCSLFYKTHYLATARLQRRPNC